MSASTGFATAISRNSLWEGVPIKVVSERAGHSSIVMTLEKYGHVVPYMQQNAAEVIDAQLREALAEHTDN
jgi:integrase